MKENNSCDIFIEKHKKLTKLQKELYSLLLAITCSNNMDTEKVTFQDLANVMGISYNSIKNILNALKREGLINLENKKIKLNIQENIQENLQSKIQLENQYDSNNINKKNDNLELNIQENIQENLQSKIQTESKYKLSKEQEKNMLEELKIFYKK